MTAKFDKVKNHMTLEQYEDAVDCGQAIKLSCGAVKVSWPDSGREPTYYYRENEIERDDTLRGYDGHYRIGFGWVNTETFSTLIEAKTFIDAKLSKGVK